MTAVPCPKCNHFNPEGSAECEICGTALPSNPDMTLHPGVDPVNQVPSELEQVSTPNDKIAIHPGEFPTKKDTGELEQALPTWLQSVRKVGQEPQAEEPATSAETPSEQPDWLAGLQAQEEEEPEVPEWLAGLRTRINTGEDGEKIEPAGPAQEQTDATLIEPPDEAELFSTDLPDLAGKNLPDQPVFETASAEETAASEEIPDWLARLDASSSPVEQPKPAGSEPGSGEVPEWLAGMGGMEMPSKDQIAAPAEETPDWLSQLPAEPAAAVEQSAMAEEPAQDGNDLLQPQAELTGEQTGIADPDVENAPIFEEQLPDWLSNLEIESKPLPVVSAFQTEEQAEELPAESLPDWLTGMVPVESAGGSIPALIQDEAPVPPAENQAALPVEEQPDWLSTIKPEETEKIAAPASSPAEPAESLEKTNLPSWVQAMRPVEAVVEKADIEAYDADTTPEDGGPLAGLRGVLPAVTSLGALQRPPAYSIKLQVDEDQQKHAARLERMLTNEAEPQPLKSQEHIFSVRRLRWAITLVLFVVIGLTVISGVNLVPAGSILYPPEMIAAMNIIGGLEPDSPILLVFDYQPALSGELEAAAAPMVEHALYAGARLTLLSTSPTGPALAERFLANTQAGNNMQAGEQYINLGYLSGGPAGMLDFAQAPAYAAPFSVNGEAAWQSHTLQGISRISDYAAVVILSDDADTGRTWVEQTGSLLGDTPMLMVISAQAEPMIRPYYDSGQIKGLVTGLAGGKAYEDAIQVPGAAGQYWNAFSTAMLAAILMIIGGATWNAIATRKQRAVQKEGEVQP